MKHWIKEARHIGNHVRVMPDKLIGVGVDNKKKADYFINYWSTHFPEIELVNRIEVNEYVYVLQIRLKNGANMQDIPAKDDK